MAVVIFSRVGGGTMIPGKRIGAEAVKVLALELGYLSHLKELYLNSE